MTRLSSELISGMNGTIAAYDIELVQKTGLTLRQIAARTAGISEEILCEAFRSERVAVVPVTAGQGVIEGFTQAVGGIIEHLGCPCFITANSDASGLAEGIEKGATIVFLADDIRFIAINLSQKRVIDNAVATGWSFAYALDACAGGLQGRDVLLIGAGQVGGNSLCALDRLGAKVGVFDIDRPKAQLLANKFKMKLEENLSDALDRYTLLFDASPAPDIICREHIKPETIISACGIPIGLSDEARTLVEDRLIHDPLQLGTAAMLAMAVRHGLSDKSGGRIGWIA
ncbi:MAG TPA: 3-methylornithyl-N6-L-lysine dehydrogenase PylD [Candidatus Heimdallarchaeota archaeon]|nr:3-methylornithyl-N6-L-lysine dehydrogenase PylD [Candidatus Heimdallarchaeota archaeon]